MSEVFGQSPDIGVHTRTGRVGQHTVEVLKRIDGQRTVGQVIDDLAAAFKAPRETIATDVQAMLGDLAAKGIVAS